MAVQKKQETQISVWAQDLNINIVSKNHNLIHGKFKNSAGNSSRSYTRIKIPSIRNSFRE